jgi:hypothetical protein
MVWQLFATIFLRIALEPIASWSLAGGCFATRDHNL